MILKCKIIYLYDNKKKLNNFLKGYYFFVIQIAFLLVISSLNTYNF